MALLRFDDLSLSFGTQIILDQAELQIEAGERLALVGLNGAGKSTLLKLISGEQQPDHGSIWRHPTARIAQLNQNLPTADERSVREVVMSGLADVVALRQAYDALTQREDMLALHELEHLQHQLEAVDGWHLEQRVESVLARLELDPDKTLAELSGGWRRRAALGAALVQNPDLLLLDEPTNHLDIEAIEWMEQMLLEFRGGLLFISHDRRLVEDLATGIIELDRGHLTAFPGSYSRYLEQKAALLEEEARHQAEFDKKLAQEERWIRQGIKARRTRNEGRVRALEALRRERGQRRERQGAARFNLDEAQKSGKLVADLQQVSVSFADQMILKDLNLTVQRGDRIGLIGPNGAGKSTLLKVILGDLTPDSGQVKYGTQLKVAYFDQLRDTLDPEKTIIDNVSGGRESVDINGRSRHIISYLADFLFSAERARTPVKALSGGECNRVLLAKLFSQPANLLVLDEPTNDLDIETLELLEEILLAFEGTILLVSHDRSFLDNVVTSTLVFEGEGVVQEYVGGYQDWLRQRAPEVKVNPSKTSRQKTLSASEEVKVPSVADAIQRQEPPIAKTSVRKLSYKLQRELDQLPEQLESAEAELARLQALCAEPDFYSTDHAQVAQILAQLEAQEASVEQLMERWLELEAMQSSEA
ncbi:ATP-binding cassette domain-containing protein [Nitrincola tapanii]|uniref:ATP-binding protein Uup n=1 Tax=Nitrincola tapanii TaxID=1708751 RepID=A0A5A9W6J7_9GAMM|nr:ATP-binding cassette domain-containing protein [Nitrincola tapanii]KAA0875825.1 ATP-binding cassette domain-containing protein [Nitrincola tapanii]